MQPLELRRVLAVSLGWDGPGQGSAELSYYIANSPNSLNQEETNAAIQTALAAWSSAADITFTQVNQPGLRDSIDISFTNIDGTGRTLAQAYFPDDVNPARIAGDIQFDISEAWEVGNTSAADALMIINELNRLANSDSIESSGLCNTNADGSVTATDALMVINVMNISSAKSLLAVDRDTDVTPVGTDDLETPSNEVDEEVTTDPLDDENSVDPGDELDTTDPVDTTDPNNDSNTPVDDGGVIHDNDEEDCERGGNHHGHFGQNNRIALGVLGKNTEDLIARFDAEANGSISESEVSSKLWGALQDLNVDADSDGNITPSELSTAITAARQEKFNSKDSDDDGLLTETEVVARRWERISAADADADLAVSFDELQNWLADQVPEAVSKPEHTHAAELQIVDRVISQFARPRQLSAFGRRRW